MRTEDERGLTGTKSRTGERNDSAMTQTVALATHNAKKGRELRDLLKPFGFEVRTLAELDITHEPDEIGTTFLDNARIKARAAMEASGLPALADDSGLCVDALGGAPGIFSARFGNFSTDGERNAHLLRLMEKQGNRACFFRCAVVLLFPDGREISAEGRCDGLLLERERGANGFGYDPLFFLPEMGQTMAEITAAQKAGISHRGRALRALFDRLSEEKP